MKQGTPFDDDRLEVIGRPKLVRPCVVTPDDERELTRAIEGYKCSSGRNFPTWSEILEVLRGLGYAKRIWQPIEPVGPPGPEPAIAGPSFQPMGADSDKGLLGWYSRVETPVGF